MVIDFLCVMQTVPKKQVVAKAPVKAAAAPAQKSSSSEDSSSEEEEEKEQKKKPMKKKPGDWTRGVKLRDCDQGPMAGGPLQSPRGPWHVSASFSQREEKATLPFIT